MTKLRFVCLLAALAAFVSLSSPTQAQFFASPAGTGNTCSAGTPCSLTTAITDAVALNGERVICIDGGVAFLSSISIVTSIDVDCPGGVVSVASNSALTLTGTSTQVVKLRNLTFDGNFNSAPVSPFIRVTGGATLIIENCRFVDNNTAFGSGTPIAIQFQPSNPAAQLIIRDTVFANNGIAPSTGGGLQVAPSAGGSASVRLERVSFDFNVTSMVLSGAVSAIMIDSAVQASRSNGIVVGSGATLDVKDSTLVFNVGSAISVAAGATVRLSNNDIKSNQVGISNSGGQALTYSNNRILGNGTTATLTPIQGGQ